MLKHRISGRPGIFVQRSRRFQGVLGAGVSEAGVDGEGQIEEAGLRRTGWRRRNDDGMGLLWNPFSLLREDSWSLPTRSAVNDYE
jgi:hypothetical protein